MKVYLDETTDVHVSDTVRYVRWDYATRGKFYNRVGTVTDIRSPVPPGALGVHFPHHAKGANLIASADHFRLVMTLTEALARKTAEQRGRQ